MSRVMEKLVVGLFCFLMITYPGRSGGQDRASSPSEAEFSESDFGRITIDSLDGADIRLFDDLAISVMLASDSRSAREINLSDLKASVHGSLASVYAQGSACELLVPTVSPGESQIVGICVFRPNQDTGLFSDLHLMMRPDLRIYVTVSLREAGVSAAKDRLAASSIRMMPPTYSPYVGALVGAFGLSLLAAVWTMSKSEGVRHAGEQFLSTQTRETSKVLALALVFALVAGLFRLFSGWGLAAVTAFVFIVLSESAGAADSPLQVSVANFWGGVAVGLLAIGLNEWLLVKLRIKRPEDKEENPAH